MSVPASPDVVGRFGRHPWRRAIVGGVTVWAGSRLLVTTIAMLALTLEGRPPLGGRSFSQLLFAWDSGWFRTIVEKGYFGRDAPGAPAFFPGYPLASRALSVLLEPFTQNAVTWAMMLVSALGGIAACIMMWRLADHAATGPRAAPAATVLLAFGPYAVFLHASYSESMFLAFAISAWYLGTTERWWWAAVAAAAASFTRANGLFLVAALLVMYLVTARRSGRRIGWRILAVPAGAAGTVVYFAWLWLQTGHVDEWWRAQRIGWDRVTRTPWDSVAETLTAVRIPWTENAQAGPQFLLDLVFGVLLIAVIAWLAHRRQWAAFTLVALTSVSLMTSNSWISLARNTTTLFPIPLTVGRGADRQGWRFALFLAMLVGSSSLLWFTTAQFAVGYWAD